MPGRDHSAGRGAGGGRNSNRPTGGRPGASRAGSGRPDGRGRPGGSRPGSPAASRPRTHEDGSPDRRGSDSRGSARPARREWDSESNSRPVRRPTDSDARGERRPGARSTDSNRSPRGRDESSRGTGAGRSERRDDSRGESRGGFRRDESRSSGSDRSGSRGPRRDDSRSDARSNSSRSDRAPAGRRDERGGARNLISETRSTVQTENLVSLPSEVDIKILPKQVLAELRNISPAAAEFVAKHLAAALYALEAGDAPLAHQHAIAARSRAARLPAVREMCGMAAYQSEMWAEALNEFRTYMRLTGDPIFLPLMADCERGLGRPQRALQIARSEQVRSLDAEARIEMRIVASGARRDLGQMDAAIAVLEIPELDSRAHTPLVTRIRYAYAEALLAAGERTKARDWFVKAALADVEDLTDAADRAVELND
jgi:hypothetical protein